MIKPQAFSKASYQQLCPADMTLVGEEKANLSTCNFVDFDHGDFLFLLMH